MSRLSKHAASNEEPNIVTCFFIVGLFAEPMVKADCIKFACLRVRPGLLGPDLCCKLIQDFDESFHFLLGVLVGGEHVSAVTVHSTVRVAVKVFTFTVTREGLKPEFFNEFGENSLIGGNPLSADFKECAVNMVVPCAPAYTFTRFKDCNGMSCLLQSVCCSESGRTCADNYDVSGQFIRSFVLGRHG